MQLTAKTLSPTTSKFEIGPLPPGLGTTLGNAMIRTLLRFEKGWAITCIKFNEPTVAHEFDTIAGVVQDIQEIILKLKQIRLKKITSDPESKIIVKLNNTTQFTAADIDKATTTFQVTNPELLICEIDPKVNLEIEFTITQGSGYIPADELKPVEQILGSFPIDAIYTPIVNAKMQIKNTLVGKKTNYEKIELEIETDNTITAETALRNSAKLLRDILTTIVEKEVNSAQSKPIDTIKNDRERINKLLTSPLSYLEKEKKLSRRVINSLNANGIERLKDIIGKRPEYLLGLPNFGKKSLSDLKEFLKKEKLIVEKNPI